MKIQGLSTTALAFAVGLLCLSALPAHAAGDDIGVKSLKGLTGVRLIIENPTPELVAGGVDEEHLRTVCELPLRQSGIHVLDADGCLKATGRPFLGVSVNTLKEGDHLVFMINLVLWQDAFCLGTKDGESHRVVSWHTDTFGTGGTDWIRDHLKEQMEAFCNDWLTANPVKRAALPLAKN